METNNWKPSKEVKLGLEHQNDLKAVLHALSSMVGSEDQESVQDMIKEADLLTGEIAELKAQIMEVKSSTYIPQRVEDETAALRQEQQEWNMKNMDARREIDKIKAELEKTDAGEDHTLSQIIQ